MCRRWRCLGSRPSLLLLNSPCRRRTPSESCRNAELSSCASVASGGRRLSRCARHGASQTREGDLRKRRIRAYTPPIRSPTATPHTPHTPVLPQLPALPVAHHKHFKHLHSTGKRVRESVEHSHEDSPALHGNANRCVPYSPSVFLFRFFYFRSSSPCALPGGPTDHARASWAQSGLHTHTHTYMHISALPRRECADVLFFSFLRARDCWWCLETDQQEKLSVAATLRGVSYTRKTGLQRKTNRGPPCNAGRVGC